MKAIGYIRVSTEEQAEKGNGLNAQTDACNAFAQKMGWELAGIFSDEGISGAAEMEKRGGLVNAIAALKRGDALLVARRDRIGRDPYVIMEIEKKLSRKGARLMSAAGEGTANDDPSNIFQRRITDAVNEHYRQIIKEKTREALQAKKRRGERVGTVQFGFQLAPDGIHLEANPQEQEILQRIEELKAAGYTLREIAAELNRQGFTTRKGSAWRFEYVANILKAA